MLPPAFLTPGVASFTEFVAMYQPDLIPGRLAQAAAEGALSQHAALTTQAQATQAARAVWGAAAAGHADGYGAGSALSPHATTIVALTYAEGIVMAGDRRATMGSYIAQRDIEKVFPAGDHGAVGIAGSAGIAVEMVRLFQTELEHYEKIEGVTLSLDGTSNMLARMIRGNLGLALQGIAALPLFAGYDTGADDSAKAGRIWSYDLVGGRYEETGYQAIGSGSLFAKSALKKTYRGDVDRGGAVRAAVEALYDAADDDSATGGPDPGRGLYPTVATVTAEGYRIVAQDEVAAIADQVLADRAGAGPQGA